jgi:hypothetical protein
LHTLGLSVGRPKAGQLACITGGKQLLTAQLVSALKQDPKQGVRSLRLLNFTGFNQPQIIVRTRYGFNR